MPDKNFMFVYVYTEYIHQIANKQLRAANCFMSNVKLSLDFVLLGVLTEETHVKGSFRKL